MTFALLWTSDGVPTPLALMATLPLKSTVPSVRSALLGLYGANRYSAFSRRRSASGLVRLGYQDRE